MFDILFCNFNLLLALFRFGGGEQRGFLYKIYFIRHKRPVYNYTRLGEHRYQNIKIVE